MLKPVLFLLIFSSLFFACAEEKENTVESNDAKNDIASSILETDTSDLHPNADRSNIEAFSEFMVQFPLLELPFSPQDSYNVLDYDRSVLSRFEYTIGRFKTNGRFRAVYCYYETDEANYGGIRTYDLEGMPVDLLQVKSFPKHDDDSAPTLSFEVTEDLKVNLSESGPKSFTKLYQIDDKGFFKLLEGTEESQCVNQFTELE